MGKGDLIENKNKIKNKLAHLNNTNGAGERVFLLPVPNPVFTSLHDDGLPAQ